MLTRSFSFTVSWTTEYAELVSICLPAVACILQQGLVNTISDRLLSSEFQGRGVTSIQPVQGRQIAESFLRAAGVVEAVNVCKHFMSGLFPGLKSAQRMDQLLLQDREETLAPCVVTRFSSAGEALPQTQSP